MQVNLQFFVVKCCFLWVAEIFANFVPSKKQIIENETRERDF